MDIKVTEELWASSMLPEGILERWLAPDGARVTAGQRVAEIRVEDALHEILAPETGLLIIIVGGNGVIEPGCLIGRVDAAPRAA